jgi:MYXO-CTERM domain-containing protein
MNIRALISGSLGLALSATSAVATAHIRLDSPTPRFVYDANAVATAPCASGTTTGVVTHLKAGQQLTVKWTETIGHPGFFRISLNTSGTDTFPAISATPENPVTPPVLADNILPHTTMTANVARMFTVTLPNVTCTKCTLQLTQFGAANYYGCADVTLDPATTSPDAGTTAGTGGATGGGVGGRTGGTGGGQGSGIGGAAGGVGGTTGGGTAGAVGTSGAGGSVGSTETGGSSGATATGGSTGSTETGGATGSSSSSAGGNMGCAIAAGRPDASAGGLLAGVMLLAVLARRRRRA